MEILEENLGIAKCDRYRLLESLGEGSFGQVRRAVDTFSGDFVAVKQVRLMSKGRYLPKAVFREIESLRQLSDGQNIVKIIDVYGAETSVCIVMEFVESSLSDIIEKTTCPISRSHLKCYYQMMLSALHHCHSRSIIHRDIKPSNFLLTSCGVLKLADFGLARIWDSQLSEDLSHQVSTRQYRAPELLFASRRYTSALDIWSTAVIMVELIILRPLFPSTNDLDQMFKVFQLMGTPNVHCWPGVESLPDFEKVHFQEMSPVDLRLVMPGANDEDLEFIKRFLVLDPSKRLSAEKALFEIPYFIVEPIPCKPFQLELPHTSSKPHKQGRKPIASIEQLLAL